MGRKKKESAKQQARENFTSPLSAPIDAQNTFFRLVEGGATAAVESLLPLVDPMWKDGLALLLALENGHFGLFKTLRGHNSSSATLWNLVLYSRANSGGEAALSKSALEWIGLDSVELTAYLSATDPLAYLLERADPKVWDSAALRAAAGAGDLEMVDVLVPFSDSKAANSRALREAAERGYADVVARLIPVSDPRAGGSLGLICAAGFGHVDCVSLLLPHSNPKDNGSAALACAARGGHWRVVDMLWDKSEPVAALNWLRKLWGDAASGLAEIEARLRADKEATLLRGATASTSKDTNHQLPKGRL